MCSLKIHDNILVSRVSIECKHDSLYVSKVKPVNKIHGQSCKRNAFVIPFVAKIWFFSREETYMF